MEITDGVLNMLDLLTCGQLIANEQPVRKHEKENMTY
jgi:hypothetical protein